ncbi:MAG: DUF2254 domain-containing protein [Parasphingopyxis sp.]
MISTLRSLWLNINASYWFYPGLFSVIAALAAIGTVWLDRNGFAEWLNNVAWIQPSRPEGARTVLTVIAGSMIATAATVFSITIAAVAYASGTYGPRLLTNFMYDKGNQLSLGVFIATFVYALMVLRVVRSEDERAPSEMDAVATALPGFTPQLSLLVATSLALFAVAVLVYFLHHIPDSIRINTVLKGIGRRLIEDIRERFPDNGGSDEPNAQKSGEAVTGIDAGYIKIIDFEALNEIAESHGACIALKVRTGDFVHCRSPLVEVSGTEMAERLGSDIRAAFSIGGMRTPTQDLEFLFDELVEIALRALSPGINDPFTALTSLHWLAAATAELGDRDLDRGPEQENYDRARIQPLEDDYAHFLERGFGGIRASAAGSVIASLKFLDSLHSAALGANSPHRLGLLRQEAERLIEQARTVLEGPSLEQIEKRYRRLLGEFAELDGEE